MIRISAALAFCALSALLVWVWAHRFEPATDALVAALPEGGITLRAAARTTRATFSPPWDASPAWFFVRYRAEAVSLARGPEKWQDGRMFLEWRDEKDGPSVIKRIHSAAGDQDSGEVVIVISNPRPGSMPVLQVENLGLAGNYHVRHLEITPAVQRAHWRVLRVLLPLGFVLTIAALMGTPGRRAWWRSLVAGAIWVAAAYLYSVPGPWESTRPLARPFVFPAAEDAGAPPLSAMSRMDVAAAAAEGAPGKLPESSHIGLRIKKMLPALRPLLHVLVLFAPVLLIAFCVGGWRALWLGLALSFSIEAAQFLFGFGFGLDDADDLVFNTLGIAAALWARHKAALFRRRAELRRGPMISPVQSEH